MKRFGWLVLVLILLAGAGIWWFFAGSAAIAARLVPADSLVFACIPNGAGVLSGYNGSQWRQIVDSPNTQPLLNAIQQQVGDKNLGLLRVLLPNLSGQSFIAVTHFDPANPSAVGVVAAMKPRLGTDSFDTFVQQLKAAYPDLSGATKTGQDTLLGVNYQWIESSSGSTDRLCVARLHGWIITTLGVASLQDTIERLQGKSSTPSLADADDFKKSSDRVGPGSQALLYVNYPRVMDLVTQRFGASNPAMADTLKKRLAGFGGAAIGTGFEGSEIVDHFSLLESRQTQADNGFGSTPCAFDTLKFTGPDTRFYYGTNVNWPQVWKNFQAQMSAGPSAPNSYLTALQTLAQSENIDLEKNIFDSLGQEYSVQVEWAADSLYPDVGIYFKVDKEADFKPAIAAFIDYTRKQFAASAVINEMQVDGHHFATLKFIQAFPVSPTITEDGPYFGIFLNDTNAARALGRDESRGLLHNDDFDRQIGSKRDGASQLVFLDAPKILDQAYRTAQPYLPMAGMINPTLAALIKDRQLPPDLTWLAPIGTWSAVLKNDDDGVAGYSRSGIGNQGILLAGGLGAGGFALQSMGLIPQGHFTAATPGNLPAPGSALVNGLAPPAVAAPTAPPPPLAPPTPAAPPVPPAPSDASTPPSPASGTH
jgi:hypothetical protein